MLKIRNYKWFSLVLFFLLWTNSALAIGVGVKPKEINLQAIVGREVISEFLVVNVSKEPAYYQIYADGLEKEIKLEPTDFRLEPDGSQIVKVKVNLKMPGRFNTNISVVARPLAGTGLAAASGVKIPITIVVSVWLWWVGLIAALLVACLGLGFGVKLLIAKRNNRLKTKV
ncbi:MAG: hypothetical protein WCW26_04050 [Candidatus Buchananbacteria bacterium]